MITNLDSGTQYFLSAVERVQRRLADANLQVASGKRVNAPSDAPDEISAILQFKAEQSRNQQIRANLALASTGADAADQSLDAGIKLMERARVLATQAGNPTMDAAGRLSIANEIRSLQEQMVAQSRTAVQGRFIFSGSQDLNPAYSLDLTAATGVTQLHTAPATVRIEDPAGGSFAATKTAQEIFDSRNPDGTVAAGNVFASLNSLRLALENNDDAALDAAAMSLRAGSDHLNAMQSFYGDVQRRIDDAVNFASSQDVVLKTQLAQKEDADVAAAAMEMTQANTQLQAAFQMRSMIRQNSLFDYLG